ncbi:Flp family type IVb pilin [Magnetovibrio sp. PR-2]|uniref:Flp family type IVb pilin n=1 Tax=Magnetovibrio sp. PR-2 TaxID=3120356 RepID=UPI002FCE182E
MFKFYVSKVRAFLSSEQGATAIEYSLIAVLICVAIVGALNLFADSMGNMFNSISNAVENAN